MNKKTIIRITGALVLIIGIISGYFLDLQSYLTLGALNDLAGFIRGLGFIGVFIYIALYVITGIFFISGTVLTLLAGAIYGKFLGILIAVIAASCQLTITFLISRYLFRDFIENKFGDSKAFTKLDQGVEEYGVSFLVLTRLVPAFPFTLQNYVYGLTSIKFTTYVIVSIFTIIPGTAIYVFISDTIISNGISISTIITLTIAGIVLFLISLFANKYMKKKGINLK